MPERGESLEIAPTEHAARPKLRVSMLDWQEPTPPRLDVDEVAVDHVSGDVRVLQNFPSAHLAQPRDVWVYLPPGYDEAPDARYPVLYMHDGNNLFDPHAAFGGQTWGVNETAEWMIQAGLVPPFMVVGVANTPDRLAEYTWHPSDDHGGGGGAAYARFLVEELKPFIDAGYRTRPERHQTAVMGSSLGGLISLYLGHHAGDVFGSVGAMSPSIWWADRQVLQDLAGIRDDLRIWLDMGSDEGATPEESARYVADAEALKELLESRGYELGRNLVRWRVDGAAHSEAAWGHRMSMAVMFLFASEDPAA